MTMIATKQCRQISLLFCLALLVSVATTIAFPVLSSALTKGLTLSPLRSELDIAPGTSLDGALTVTNSTDKAMTVSLNAEEFSVINQQYDYAFTQESQVAKWVTFTPTTVTLAVGEAKTVSFRVSAPLSAEPGGRYISLFASTNTGTQGQGVDSLQRVASLLYITVLGNVTRSGHLVSLTAPWVMSSGGQWSMALQNTGTTHFRSRYTVDMQDLFGHTVGTSVAGDDLILPGTIRLITDQLPLPGLPGIYKYVYTIGLGDTSAVTATRIVLYVPPVFILTGIAILFLFVVSVKRRRIRAH